MSIIKQFPLEKARSTQVAVLNAVEKAFKDGYKNVLLEAPVGSGKSAIAIACAKFYEDAHILTPRKSLQNQYVEDFAHEDIAMMKGRSAYPCTIDSSFPEYKKVIEIIHSGQSVQPKPGELSCSSGPCLGNREVLDECTDEGKRPCPYHVAIDTAQKTPAVIHNLHSFIFQAYFTSRFQKRRLLVIDECHEVEGIIRGFAERKVTIPTVIPDSKLEETEQFTLLTDWADWLSEFSTLFTDNNGSKTKLSDLKTFLLTLSTMKMLSDKFGDKFVPVINKEPQFNRVIFKFIPEKVGDLVNQYLLNFGDLRLLMSGTIYNKSQYCRNNGLVEEETCFIRIGSTFPKESRPIYLKKEYCVDTSHQMWDDNFQEMTEKIEKIFDIFEDVKGLIHTPSYQASIDIFRALRHTGRVMMHDKDDLSTKLDEFYKSEEPMVFLSPVCQQGVDFKYDRARFQIVLRVPYANTSDEFNSFKVKNDFNWYNYQALVLFGQQMGRVNRADDDFGVTILMDERFRKFVSRNRNVLPKWLVDAIIF